MTGALPSAAKARLRARLERLYPHQTDRCLARLEMMLGRYGAPPAPPTPAWDQRTALLITYADMIRSAGESPLAALKRFLDTRLADAIRAVHLLPFYPSSSDDGFSVMHYRRVDPDVGDWPAIRALGEHFELMFDLVLNHVSRRSGWFQDYQLGVAPGRHYFIETDPAQNLSAVTRPRTSPLITPVMTRGGLRHVWTTFSDDQIDLNYANPDVLFEILDILLFYVAQGARAIRLDAIAYLWKKIGTPCIHLPETHEIVKLFRDVIDSVAPGAVLISETNVPHTENVSYFGAGDEAHVVYQFSLPPLLLHALVAGNATHLTRWAASLEAPPPGCTFLNFTASHDGIGIRPIEGVLPAPEIDRLVAHIEGCGGLVSKKADPDGRQTPYELNATYFDALGSPGTPDPALHIARFMCSQAVAMSLKGIPAVYFNSLVAAPNDLDAVKRTGRARSINRHKWDEGELAALLGDQATPAATVLDRYVRLLRTRVEHPAFHPDGGQRILDLGPQLFAVERTAPDGTETILSISNVTGRQVEVPPDERIGATRRNLLGTDRTDVTASLAPYETCWLA